MGREPMDFEPTLSPRFAVYLHNYLVDQHVDPVEVFKECGVPVEPDQEYLQPISVSVAGKLFETAAKYTKNSNFGLQMGQAFHYEAAGLMVLTMLAASSVKEGLRTLCRYDKYLDTGLEATCKFSPDISEFTTNVVDPTHATVDQLNEYLITFLVQTLNKATSKRVPVTEVWFRHSCSKDIKALERFFGAPVKYGKTDNRIFFSSDYLHERFTTTNRFLFHTLTTVFKSYFSSVGEKYDFTDAVSREIIRQTNDESPSMENIAEGLAITPRTLRRRLADTGYSFQDIKNATREKRAKYYLSNTDMPFTEISIELGFSQLSAFSRAFRSWVGETPQSYRHRFRSEA